MATTTEPVIASQWATLADLVVDLGDIPLERIRAVPPPGTATEKDVLEAESRYGRLCELIDGVLVEKTMGIRESLTAARIIHLLQVFLDQHDLGAVSAPDGPFRILPGQVRLPDVSFIGRQHLPEGRLPEQAIPAVAADLAVEILSKTNTPGEMGRKLHDYFAAGVRLVWYIDPARRVARAYSAPDQVTHLGEADTLSGSDVLPGFVLSLQDLFAYVDRIAPPP